MSLLVLDHEQILLSHLNLSISFWYRFILVFKLWWLFFVFLFFYSVFLILTAGESFGSCGNGHYISALEVLSEWRIVSASPLPWAACQWYCWQDLSSHLSQCSCDRKLLFLLAELFHVWSFIKIVVSSIFRTINIVVQDMPNACSVPLVCPFYSAFKWLHALQKTAIWSLYCSVARFFVPIFLMVSNKRCQVGHI